jgi:hypothetical protein
MARKSQQPFGYSPQRVKRAQVRLRSTLGQWFRVWRWPAGVVAGFLLWIALVAVVGAVPMTPLGQDELANPGAHEPLGRASCADRMQMS